MRTGLQCLRMAALCAIGLLAGRTALCQTGDQAPAPLLKAGQPVNWWFVFKFNAVTFPRAADSTPACLFGGTPGDGVATGPMKKTPYTNSDMGQDYVYASDTDPTLQKGSGY